MGAVFGSQDFGSRDNRRIENAVKDLGPDTKDSVIKLLNSWEGKESATKLREILGQNKSEESLKKIADHANLSEDDEQD
jgi:hypothetical protein